jgi:hypothetical protein
MQIIKLFFTDSKIHIEVLIILFQILYEKMIPHSSLLLLSVCTQYLCFISLAKSKKTKAVALFKFFPSICQNH